MTGRHEIGRLQKKLEATLSRAPAPNTDIEVQADFAKYFCVLVSGFLENAIVELILNAVQKRSSPEISLFVERQLEYWTNPKCEKIVQLFGDFSVEWRIAVESHLVDERKAAVNSLVALRHRI